MPPRGIGPPSLVYKTSALPLSYKGPLFSLIYGFL